MGFLLSSPTAERLYAAVKDLPIVDYHCHLSPQEIWEDRPFDNIGEVWLGGDHYKWRLMRTVGIDENDIDYIFTPFFSNGKKAENTKSSGSGLGLPITKSIIEKLGGKISVKSTLGKGSCFTLSFPHYKKTCNKTKQVL